MGQAKFRRAAERENLEAFERAKTPEGMSAERAQYAKTWSERDAAAFAEGGHYDWMASHVPPGARVLEVGTGDGQGTLVLLRAGHRVVGVDENPFCLDRTKVTLERAGFGAAVHLRGAVRAAADGYAIDYAPIPEFNDAAAILVEGDTLNDPQLIQWLGTQKFDAVCCWLMGSHRARQLNAALPREPAGHYRLRVQNALYRLADTVLKPGGMLSIVDRGMIGRAEPTIEVLRRDIVQSHQDQASPTSLVVDSTVGSRACRAPDGLPMELTPGTSGMMPTDVEFGLHSIIARKP